MKGIYKIHKTNFILSLGVLSNSCCRSPCLKVSFAPMKTAISSQQLVYFRKQGHIRFENYPLDFQKIQKSLTKAKSGRDLWRDSPDLKKMILHSLAPLALELTKKRSIRLCCDQWIDTAPTVSRIQDMFCFQSLACFFVFSKEEEHPEKGTLLDIYEPSSLASLLPINAYLVAFGQDNALLIENSKDPFTLLTRNLGYVYGDHLRNEFHPLIHPK